jgi:hypothetical protein
VILQIALGVFVDMGVVEENLIVFDSRECIAILPASP